METAQRKSILKALRNCGSFKNNDKPQRIVQTYRESGVVYFQIEWKQQYGQPHKQNSFYTRRDLRSQNPQFLLDYYESITQFTEQSNESPLPVIQSEKEVFPHIKEQQAFRNYKVQTKSQKSKTEDKQINIDDKLGQQIFCGQRDSRNKCISGIKVEKSTSLKKKKSRPSPRPKPIVIKIQDQERNNNNNILNSKNKSRVETKEFNQQVNVFDYDQFAKQNPHSQLDPKAQIVIATKDRVNLEIQTRKIMVESQDNSQNPLKVSPSLQIKNKSSSKKLHSDPNTNLKIQKKKLQSKSKQKSKKKNKQPQQISPERTIRRVSNRLLQKQSNSKKQCPIKQQKSNDKRGSISNKKSKK